MFLARTLGALNALGRWGPAPSTPPARQNPPQASEIELTVLLLQVADLLVGPQGSTVRLRFLRPIANSTKFVGPRPLPLQI